MAECSQPENQHEEMDAYHVAMVSGQMFFLDWKMCAGALLTLGSLNGIHYNYSSSAITHPK